MLRRGEVLIFFSHSSPAGSGSKRKDASPPQLAARLEALAHVMAHPEAVITRAARRLHATRMASLPLVRDAAALPGPPHRAAHIATVGHTLALTRRRHDALVSLEMS